MSTEMGVVQSSIFAKQGVQDATVGKDCGPVGRAVVYDTRNPQFESRHQQILFFYQLYLPEYNYVLFLACALHLETIAYPGLDHCLHDLLAATFTD